MADMTTTYNGGYSGCCDTTTLVVDCGCGCRRRLKNADLTILMTISVGKDRSCASSKKIILYCSNNGSIMASRNNIPSVMYTNLVVCILVVS